jgi:hypothetical protein
MLSLQIDDELYRLASDAASAQGQSVDEFAAAALRTALTQPIARMGLRNGVPIIEVSGGPPIDPERVRKFIQEEGF